MVINVLVLKLFSCCSYYPYIDFDIAKMWKRDVLLFYNFT